MLIAVGGSGCGELKEGETPVLTRVADELPGRLNTNRRICVSCVRHPGAHEVGKDSRVVSARKQNNGCNQDPTIRKHVGFDCLGQDFLRLLNRRLTRSRSEVA